MKLSQCADFTDYSHNRLGKVEGLNLNLNKTITITFEKVISNCNADITNIPWIENSEMSGIISLKGQERK